MSGQDVDLLKRLQEIANQMKVATDSVQSLINELSGGKVTSKETMNDVEGQLKIELGESLQHVDVVSSSNDIRIKPKRFLGS